MNYKTILVAGMLLMTSLQAMTELKVSNSAGAVTFSGKHAGMSFNGEFKKWTASLNLSEAEGAEQAAFVNASFDLSSADTGDSLYNETLLEGDWFDVDNHPTGTFESESVVRTSQGYEVKGVLSLRGKPLPISFLLTQKGERLLASFDVDRIAYGIGLDSDPEAEWVSQYIKLELDIPSS